MTLQYLEPSETELSVRRKILYLKVPDIAISRLNFNLSLHRLATDIIQLSDLYCMTNFLPHSKTLPLTEQLRDKVNGDWDGQGAHDMEGTNRKNSREDDRKGFIDKVLK